MTINIRNTSLDHEDVLCAETKFQHRGSLGQKELLDALKLEGIPEQCLPNSPTDHVCLGRAVKGYARRNDRVESIPGGWVLTLVDKGKLDLEDEDNDGTDAHVVDVTAKILKVEDTTTVKIIPEDHPAAPAIRAEFEAQRGLFRCCEDVSRWLSQTIIPWVGGVASKARGGSYYVMRGTGLDRMKKVKKALDSVSSSTNTVFKPLKEEDSAIVMPVVTQGTHITLKPEFAELDAVRIMLDSVIRETDTMCDDLHTKLTSNKLGARALKTQIDRAIDHETKVEGYFKALGIDMGDIGDRLKELKGGLGVALAATEEL